MRLIPTRHPLPSIRDPARRYIGLIAEQMEWEVWLEEYGKQSPLDWRLDVFNHSPTGLSWGYGGSGPSQCALAILADAVGVARAVPLYMDFKFNRIARFDKDEGWELSHAEVLAWVETHEAKTADTV